MYGLRDGMDSFGFFRRHVLAAPYVLRPTPEVLVIGVGGGADVLNALGHGARRVVGAEIDPVTVEILTRDYAGWTGNVFRQPRVELVAAEGRHFARSTDQRFDVVQLTGVDTLAALSSGANLLAENYLYTIEALDDYLTLLRPGGVLSIAGLDYHPGRAEARHVMRFAALAQAALRARGVERPEEHVMIVSQDRAIALFAVLVRAEPFTASEVDAMQDFLDASGFESWYLPGRPERQRPEFRTLLAGAPQEREHFFADTFLDLRATSDDRPFFFSFYKWRHLFEHRREIDPGHNLATGQLVLVLILVLASLFSAVAIALPLLRTPARARSMPARWGFLAYFAALGAGSSSRRSA